MTDYDIAVKLRGRDYEDKVLLMAKIQKRLRKELCVVKFRKADDSIRTMWCTLNPTFLPPRDEAAEPKVDRVATEKQAKQVMVWDIEAEGWRSFSIDTFRRLSIVEPA